MKPPGQEDAASRRSVVEALVEEHARAVGEACMALLGSRKDAEEALVEVLAEALRQPPSDLGDRAVRVWLLGIARRRCAARLEARDRQPELASEATTEEGALPSRARRLLRALRPTGREALVLRFHAELTVREVGEACGVDEAAARARISRGLEHFSELMSKDRA
jgi:RNA polymerase sigma-70 factor, ECF subfamily